MRFFDSEIVQQEMKEIARLQEAVYSKVFSFAHMGKQEKLKHVEMLEELMKKQQVLYARLSLSDDPEAKIMKEHKSEFLVCTHEGIGHMFPKNKMGTDEIYEGGQILPPDINTLDFGDYDPNN